MFVHVDLTKNVYSLDGDKNCVVLTLELRGGRLLGYRNKQVNF